MKGQKTGGRQKNTPNKVTADVRSIFAGIMERNAGSAEEWILRVAEDDPHKATDLLLRLAEFHVPKLQRQEVAGDPNNPVRTHMTVEFVKP